MRPTIAVMPLVDDERESLWMLPGYMDAVREAGAVPFMPALTTEDDEIQQIFTMCDGLLMTGGHDVEPRQYGEEPRFDNVVPNAERDTMELALLRLALAHDKPVFGICRGLQIMNVACGGTLYQNLPSEFDSGVDHHQRPPYDRPCTVCTSKQERHCSLNSASTTSRSTATIIRRYASWGRVLPRWR